MRHFATLLLLSLLTAPALTLSGCAADDCEAAAEALCDTATACGDGGYSIQLGNASLSGTPNTCVEALTKECGAGLKESEDCVSAAEGATCDDSGSFAVLRVPEACEG